MNLYTYCKSCKKNIKVKSEAVTRPDLQMEKGDEFMVNCQNCGTMEKKHVNEITAEPNNIILMLGVGIGIVVSIFLWIYLGLIGILGIIIPFVFWQQQMNTTKSYNKYMIRRK